MQYLQQTTNLLPSYELKCLNKMCILGWNIYDMQYMLAYTGCTTAKSVEPTRSHAPGTLIQP